MLIHSQFGCLVGEWWVVLGFNTKLARIIQSNFIDFLLFPICDWHSCIVHKVSRTSNIPCVLSYLSAACQSEYSFCWLSVIWLPLHCVPVQSLDQYPWICYENWGRLPLRKSCQIWVSSFPHFLRAVSLQRSYGPILKPLLYHLYLLDHLGSLKNSNKNRNKKQKQNQNFYE